MAKTVLLLWAVVLHPSQVEAAAGGVGLLSVVPGLGQAVNGNPFEGLGWFATTVGLYLSGGPVAQQVGYDLWQYNMYDAYRDAKPGIRRFKDHNVFQNYAATFNPANLLDPIGAPIFATGAVVGSRNNYAGIRNPTYIAYYGFVGLGEEALFRGFLFPALSDWMGTFAGAVVSSAAFSLFHATNGSGALGTGPLTFRFIGGMLFAWQAHRNSYDLRKNIFAHSWWDIFVGPGSPDGVHVDGGQMGLRIRY